MYGTCMSDSRRRDLCMAHHRSPELPGSSVPDHAKVPAGGSEVHRRCPPGISGISPRARPLQQMHHHLSHKGVSESVRLFRHTHVISNALVDSGDLSNNTSVSFLPAKALKQDFIIITTSSLPSAAAQCSGVMPY
jgi:hypothetical protein